MPDRVINNVVQCRVNEQLYSAKYFNPPLSSIDKMTLQFYTPSGELYNFNNNGYNKLLYS